MTRVPFDNLAEAERLAKKTLPRPVWLAVKAGNEQGWTLDENLRAYNDLGFTPTIFDRPTIGKIDTKTHVLGVDIDFPIMSRQSAPKPSTRAVNSLPRRQRIGQAPRSA